MTLGMSLSAFTAFHVALSLIGIGSGLVVLLGLIANRLYPLLTGLFLLTTVATSVTGFMSVSYTHLGCAWTTPS